MWDANVASNAGAWADTCAGQYGHSAHTRPDGTNSYALTPMSGENVAVGTKSPEEAVELWYNEINDPGYTPGVSPDLQPGTGHYTAMMWSDTRKLGCAQRPCSDGSPKPVHVCHYAYGAPNVGYDLDYEANLPRTNTPSSSEATCCQTMYGDDDTTNPYIDPDAQTTTVAPIPTDGPTMGIFTTNEGNRYLQLRPWLIDTVWVYGTYESGWFKMVSVDQEGNNIECRHSQTYLTDDMTSVELDNAWEAAYRGGEYTVEVTVGDTSAPAPAEKEFPEEGDAEGTIYVSNGDQAGSRRRMRDPYYAIADRATYQVVKSGAQCLSRNKWYGCWLKTAGDCAKKMKKEGKKSFIWYGGSADLSYYDMKCYGEETESPSCPEGFSSTGYNSRYSFYRVLV